MTLETLFQQLNAQYFEDKLPPLKLNWNSKLRTTAGRFSPGSRNPLRPREAFIEVANYLKTLSDGEQHIRDTLLHEMIHYWLWWSKKPYGHTKEFYQIMRRVGAKRFNPVPKESAVKYWYECQSCKVRLPARRKLGRVACASCCKKYNKNQFAERFLLHILDENFKPSPMPRPLITREEIEALPYHEAIRKLEALKKLVMKSKIRIFKA